ncbi:hypothetical protein [Micromonospora sp. NPDC050200]|uniref:hypothetical protein n=1 Tax=Micromonospora sp. NPDC050200 TaxID=3155664 RepID=UPI0033E01BC8
MDKINGWRTKIFVWIGLPVIAAIGLMLGATDLVPAWQAKGGSGTPGTFTAVDEECSRRNCEWHGDFVAADGGARRTDVILYDAPDGLSQGGTAPARDTDARKGVFSTTGGSTWLLLTGLTVAGLVAAVAWVVIVVRLIRRRRQADETSAPFAPSS